MASKSFALFLLANLLLLSIGNACTCTRCGCVPSPPKPKPKPCPTPTPTPTGATCPRDALKFGVCADVLGLVNVKLGSPPTLPCCSLLEGLVDLEAAVCLCTVIKANILGINLNLPVSLSLLLNVCGKSLPDGFRCA